MSGATCRSCGAPIEWALTAKGRRMPVDLEPAAAGLLLVHDGRVEHADRAPADWPRSPRRTSHFATCPNARKHRREGSA